MARRRESSGGKRGTGEGKVRSAQKRVSYTGAFPTKDEVLVFLQGAPEGTGKREIARAFGIKGDDRQPLKQLLAEMTGEGLISGNRRQLKERGGLPAVAVIDITGPDADGELTARPASWDEAEGAPPTIRVSTGSGGAAAANPALIVGAGDRVLAKLRRLDGEDGGYDYEAEPVKAVPRTHRRLLGIFQVLSKGGPGGLIAPVDRRDLKQWPVQAHDQGGAQDGDLVRFELETRRHLTQARIVEVLGNPSDQRQTSLIAVHAHGIPEDFLRATLDEVADLVPPDLSKRTDLRDLTLLTIDPPDARDHDDAVFATPDDDAANPGGWLVIVAIADVAHYVRPGSALDREAFKRGNSVYFPDRVVPMLPERISNELCSLREGEERACLAVRMVFDKHGEKRGHTFMRALMRSHAKLSYVEAQAAIDGNPNARSRPLLETALKPLWAAYATLKIARERRSPLDLDLPERKIKLDAEGRVAQVVVPERLAAHRLIEEFMIQANVAAAETLEQHRTPLIYRAHAEPTREKLIALGEFLETFELSAPKPGSVRAAQFNGILAFAKGKPFAELINEVILRSQAQAEYTSQNYGHFGLNLRKYAHFTSPIRRYADLIVHRALIKACKFGADGLPDEQAARLNDIAQAISLTERRAMMAERETNDRLIAAHLAGRVGAKFHGRIAGVTRSGLFVKLAETGADGFVPVSTIGEDYFAYDEVNHLLVGERTGEAYRLGDTVEVRLVEAIPTAGALRFEMLTPGKRGVAPRRNLTRKRFGAPRRKPR